jgi:hypothetical protein
MTNLLINGDMQIGFLLGITLGSFFMLLLGMARESDS